MITTEIHQKRFVIDGRGFLTQPEERELESWLKGHTAEDAARDHHVSAETVRWHRKAIREKTNQKNTAGVLTYCLAHQYVRVLVIALILLSAGPAIRTAKTTTPVRRGPSVTVRVGRREQITLSKGGLT